MSSPRKALYQRLPEFYRIRDDEQFPAGQLRAYLDVLDTVPAALRDNIEALYHDFFVETCADWTVPYIADLLGASHLAGDPWTLRADVARTLFHRRRKGTLGAVESLAHTLTGWAAQAVELRNNLVWSQHLNHQRPDAGGNPPLSQRTSQSAAVRGGTIPIRDPASLSFMGGPFDPFAHVADVKPGQVGAPRYNLPNLGVFLWRLEDYTVPLADPGFKMAADSTRGAAAVVRCVVHPQGDPMVLFNTHRYRMDQEPPDLSHPDEVPGPMPRPRLSSDAEQGNPAAYVRVDYHDATGQPVTPGPESPGLVLHLPDSVVPPPPLDDPERDPALRWSFRGANLCDWESGLAVPIREYEIAVDPERGRIMFGLSDRIAEADPLASGLFVTYTYGFSGPTGAHPVSREPLEDFEPLSRDGSLEATLSDAALDTRITPFVLEIQDSATYTLDVSHVSGAEDVGGVWSLRLAQPITIRAATNQRPVIRLVRPLRFRPADLTDGEGLDVLSVHLEGLYLTWDRDATDFSAPDTPIVARAAVNLLRFDGCTLDPGGAWQLDGTESGTRQDRRPGFALTGDYDFDPAEPGDFDQVPCIELNRSISGAVLAEEDAYVLSVNASIIDAHQHDETSIPLAIGSLSDPAKGWGPALDVSGLTCIGRVRVASVDGSGGIWLHSLQAHDDQTGCVRFSYFSGVDDRLPPHHGCVLGVDAAIGFSDERFGMPGYLQLQRRSDSRILEQGPGRDLMGAFGYLQNTHKWNNLSIRFREFMPVGIRPLLIPVT